MGKHYERTTLLAEIQLEDGKRIPAVVEEAMDRIDAREADSPSLEKFIEGLPLASLKLAAKHRDARRANSYNGAKHN